MNTLDQTDLKRDQEDTSEDATDSSPDSTDETPDAVPEATNGSKTNFLIIAVGIFCGVTFLLCLYKFATRERAMPPQPRRHIPNMHQHTLPTQPRKYRRPDLHAKLQQTL